MKIYTNSDLAVVILKAEFAYYSALKAMDYARERNLSAPEEGDDHLLPFMFYQHNFVLHLSELMTFFYHREDQEILSKLETTEEQRRRIREFRHVVAHIDTFDNTKKRMNNFEPDDTTNPMVGDLMQILFHLIRIIEKINIDSKTEFIKELNAIVGLFPEGRFKRIPE